MPFLGKDWRSSGEHWIRTELGWERVKVLECILDNLNNGLKKEHHDYAKKESGSSREEKKSSSSSGEMKETEGEEEENILDSDDSDDEFNSDEEEEEEEKEEQEANKLEIRKQYKDLRKLCISTSSLSNYKTRQPHIIYLSVEAATLNRATNAPKWSVSEVLNALDMPGAVKDTKRFNYVCKLVQLIINEKLNQLSGNAQRTLFLIVREMLIQVIRTQENLNVMRKLLFDFKKKIQDSLFFYFYYIGSKKLGERHLATISKWQEMLENPNHRRVKRLKQQQQSNQQTSKSGEDNKENLTNGQVGFDHIPVDCKLEIMRRLNTGLDLVNLAKCSRSLNDIVSQELTIWKDLCQFHFQQANINSFVNRSLKLKSKETECEKSSGGDAETVSAMNSNTSKHLASFSEHKHGGEQLIHDLDWKLIYFKLKRRYGHREVYVDMIHKCFYCKCLFWKVNKNKIIYIYIFKKTCVIIRFQILSRKSAIRV